MNVVSEINSKQEFNEMKLVMEIFIISTRIKQIAVNS